MGYKAFIITMIVIFSLNFASAQEINLELGKIVVTPSRKAELYGEFSRSVDIITHEEIETSNAYNLSELLDRLSSITIINYGSLGAAKSVRLRGSSAEQVLVMVDGRIVNNPRDGQVDLNEFPLENIERIEVLRGAASSLYGSSAVGGVINVITESAGDIPTTIFSSKFATFRTWGNELTHGAKMGNLDYFLTISNIESEAHRDNADYQAYNLTSKFNYRFNGEDKLTLNAGYYQGEVGTPGKVTNPDL